MTVLLPDDERARTGEIPDVAWTSSPLRGRDLGVIVVAWLGAVCTLTAVGSAIVGWWDDSILGSWDADVNRWFEERRTDTWVTFADFGSAFSDTVTVVALALVCVPLFTLLFRRWHDYALVFMGLMVETTAFVAASTLVARDRPPVEQLGAAATNSFPSGHIAASVVLYGGLAVVVFDQTRRSGARAAAAAVGIMVPLIVIVSRITLGMHYVTDAVGGVALGAFTLAVMHRVVHGGDDRGDGTTAVRDDHTSPEEVRTP
jgi:undecaprenyl-diphosphatase